MKESKIIGLKIHTASIDEAIKSVTKIASQPNSKPIYIVQPHVEFLEKALKERPIKTLLHQAHFRFPNGVPLQWASYWEGLPNRNFIKLIKSLLLIVFRPSRITKHLPDRFNSNTFTWPLLEAAAQQKLKIFLVGSPRYKDINYSADYLRRHIKGLQVVGTCEGRDVATGYFSEDLKSKLLDLLKSTRPDIVLVALGFPRQEKLMAELVSKIDHGVLIGEGGTFDYRHFGGKKRRAPKLIQSAGLEWAWRLILEPKRIKRQLAIPRFIWQVYQQNK